MITLFTLLLLLQIKRMICGDAGGKFECYVMVLIIFVASKKNDLRGAGGKFECYEMVSISNKDSNYYKIFQFCSEIPLPFPNSS